MAALLLDPFLTYGFMRTALIACLALAMANGPIGVLLLQRRMTLTADVLSHAVMPGAALGFFIGGYSILALSVGGVAAGVLVATLATVTLRAPEEAVTTLMLFYLLSLAGGVLLVSLRGSNIDLMHVLFGTVLAVDVPLLAFIATATTIIFLTLAAIWRPLALEGFDPLFLRTVGGGGPLFRGLFMALVVLCLVAGFQAYGTLLAIGPMLLPAIAARQWSRTIQGQTLLAVGFGFAGGLVGLLLSYHLNVASGPAIVLACGAIAVVSQFAPRRRIALQDASYHAAG